MKSIGQKNTTAYLPLICSAKLKLFTISPVPSTAAEVKSGALRVTNVIKFFPCVANVYTEYAFYYINLSQYAKLLSAIDFISLTYGK